MPRSGGSGRSQKRRVSLCGLSLLATAALVLSGCGSASHPAGKVVDAAQKTAALSWVRYQIRFTGPHLFPPTVRVTGARGAYDFKAGWGGGFVGVQRHGGGSQNVFVESTQKQVVVAPVPAPAGLLPAGKVWMSAPLRGRKAGGTLAAQVEGLAPLLAVDELRWGTAAASDLGTSAVGHVPMDEYRVSIDLAKAHSAATRHGDAAVAAAIEHELHSSPSGRLNMDVWVNGPGYISQIFERAPGSALGGTSLSFTSYTQPYTGAFPPPAVTVSLASLRHGRRSVWALATGS